MMTVTEIIAKLAYDDIVFPHEAVAEAVLQCEAITPELLRILEDASTNVEELAYRDDYMGLVFAMYLLSQFREARAYQPLVKLFTADQKIVMDMFGDIVTEDLGRMLASVCHGDTSLICGILENEALDDYIRMAAMNALGTLVAEGITSREDVITYFKSLFQGGLKRKHSVVWSGLVGECCDLGAVEAAVEIERAFTDGIVDVGFIGREDVKRYLSISRKEAMNKLKADRLHCFIDDTDKEISSWAYYRADQPSNSTQKEEPVFEPVPIRTGPKVGRNDPCPCGSGKKYKKCCG